MFAFSINGAKIDIFSYLCPTKDAKYFCFWQLPL